MFFFYQPDRAHLKEKQRLMTNNHFGIKLLCSGSAQRPQFTDSYYVSQLSINPLGMMATASRPREIVSRKACLTFR